VSTECNTIHDVTNQISESYIEKQINENITNEKITQIIYCS